MTMLQESFTPRETDILALILEGYSSRGIAQKLFLAPETVRWYIKQIYSKLDAHSRDEAVARAREFRIILTPGPQPETPDAGLVPVATLFIGREALLSLLAAHVEERTQRLISLIGPPGVGKTRLSKELLRRCRYAFDECFFIDLSDEITVKRVALKIAETLELQIGIPASVVSALRMRFRDQRTLLVLDNFEQVIDAAPLVADLCESCPRLSILVTSREALRIEMEWLVEVPPLDLPPANQSEFDVATLSLVESVALFIQKAQVASPRFKLDPDNAATIALICRRLDGLPLALELAAARIRLVDPDSLLERLDSRFELLSRGARDLPRRHASLRGSVQWSHDLLSQNEKRFFDRLAVFHGGWTLEAAEAIGAVRPRVANVLDALDGLVSKSLVSCAEGRDGHIRFSCLETIREFALERLVESEVAHTAVKAHAEYFAQFAEQSRAWLLTGEQLTWYHRLENEHDNHRAALRFAETTHDSELLMRLTGALGWFWYTNSRLLEGGHWAVKAIALDRTDLPLPVRIDAFHAAGLMQQGKGEHTRARDYFSKALTLSREGDDEFRQAASFFYLCMTSWPLGEYARAYEEGAEALARMRKSGSLQLETHTLDLMGLCAEYAGRHELAIEHFREGIDLALVRGEVDTLAYLYDNLGWCLTDDDPVEARELLEQALDSARAVHNRRFIADALIGLSILSRKAGDLEEALSHVNEGYRTAQSTAEGISMISALVELARVSWSMGDAQTASDSLQAADSLAAETDDFIARESVLFARAELGLEPLPDTPPN